MAEEVNTPVSVDATSTLEDTARSEAAVAEPAVAEATLADDGAVATAGVTEGMYLCLQVLIEVADAISNSFCHRSYYREAFCR